MKKLVYIFTFILAASLCSCDDFLDEKTNKSTSIVPSTTEHLDFLLNKYDVLGVESNQLSFLSSDSYGIIKEIFDANKTSYSINDLNACVWTEITLPADKSNSFWKFEYNKVFYANMVLYYLPRVAGSDLDKERLNREARFIRAYSLWNLAQAYCLPYNETNKNELGLVLRQTTSFDESLRRATLEETYRFIESELTAALATETKLVAVNNRLRIWRESKAAVNAFAARFYLSKNNYAKALAHAEVALKEQSAMVNYNTDMKFHSITNSYTVNGKVEKMTPPMTSPYSPGQLMEWKESYYYRNVLTNSWAIPSRELLSIYDQSYDLRYKYHMVKNFSYSKGLISPAYSYPGYVFRLTDTPSGPSVAEMLLIKAECLARDGKIDEAMQAVNILRKNRMDAAAPAAVINLTATTQAEAVKKIVAERWREMPFTQRWNDIRRLNSNEDPSDDIGDIVKTFYPFNSTTVLFDQGVKTYTLPKNSRKYAYPIPSTEIESSFGSIEQNRY